MTNILNFHLKLSQIEFDKIAGHITFISNTYNVSITKFPPLLEHVNAHSLKLEASETNYIPLDICGLNKDILKAKSYIAAILKPEEIYTIKLPVNVDLHCITDDSTVFIQKIAIGHCTYVTINELERSVTLYGSIRAVSEVSADIENTIKNTIKNISIIDYSSTEISKNTVLMEDNVNMRENSKKTLETTIKNTENLLRLSIDGNNVDNKDPFTETEDNLIEFGLKRGFSMEDINLTLNIMSIHRTFTKNEFLTVIMLLCERKKNNVKSLPQQTFNKTSLESSISTMELYESIDIQPSMSSSSICSSTNKHLINQNNTTDYFSGSTNFQNDDESSDYYSDQFSANSFICQSNNKKVIIIDGCNVAMNYGKHEKFSCYGIKIAVDEFLYRKHSVKVFLPNIILSNHGTFHCKPIENKEILDELIKMNILVLTPNRRLSNNSTINYYDDGFIIQYAYNINGIIVSNDNYTDICKTNSQLEYFMDCNLLMYTFVDDQIIFPLDPLGRNGPTLERFLGNSLAFKQTHLEPCPYGKKCRFGIKCRFDHSNIYRPSSDHFERNILHENLLKYKIKYAHKRPQSFSHFYTK